MDYFIKLREFDEIYFSNGALILFDAETNREVKIYGEKSSKLLIPYINFLLDFITLKDYYNEVCSTESISLDELKDFLYELKNREIIYFYKGDCFDISLVQKLNLSKTKIPISIVDLNPNTNTVRFINELRNVTNSSIKYFIPENILYDCLKYEIVKDVEVLYLNDDSNSYIQDEDYVVIIGYGFKKENALIQSIGKAKNVILYVNFFQSYAYIGPLFLKNQSLSIKEVLNKDEPCYCLELLGKEIKDYRVNNELVMTGLGFVMTDIKNFVYHSKTNYIDSVLKLEINPVNVSLTRFCKKLKKI